MNTWFRTPHARETEIDVSSVAFWSQTFEARDSAFAQLRRDHPVSWHPPLETPGLSRRQREAGFWAVTRATDIAAVSRPDLFSSEIGQVSVRAAPFRIDPNMLVVDPPRHTDLRRIIGSAFTSSAISRLEGGIDRSAKQIVARAATNESFDYVAAVATELPLRTLARLIGIPDAFIVAADAHVRGGIPSRLEDGRTHRAYFVEQTAHLTALCSAVANWKRHRPGDDLMTCLVEARIDGKRLDEATIQSTIMLLIVAGDDTTKQAISLSMLALDQFPAERAWLVSGNAARDLPARPDAAFNDRFDAAFDELIRFASPVISFARTATQDLEIAGARITAGDKVALFYCSGNRDEALFTSPARLDLQRRAATQVGFGGGGVHFCLGSRLARAQVRAILRETLTRMPGLDLGTPEYGFGESVHSVLSLPATIRRI